MIPLVPLIWYSGSTKWQSEGFFFSAADHLAVSRVLRVEWERTEVEYEWERELDSRSCDRGRGSPFYDDGLESERERNVCSGLCVSKKLHLHMSKEKGPVSLLFRHVLCCFVYDFSSLN